MNAQKKLLTGFFAAGVAICAFLISAILRDK